MGDWEFLYEMHDRGCSAEEIADAAGSGMAPWEYLSSEWVDAQFDTEMGEDARALEPTKLLKSRGGLPFSALEQNYILQDLVDCAARHYQNTGRYLQVWGELGEIYAEVKFGLCRHGTHHAGSDGTINGVLVEVKTISPEKSSDRIVVKREGDFEKLLIVRIDRNFRFQGKIFDRCELKGHAGKFLRGRLNGSSHEA